MSAPSSISSAHPSDRSFCDLAVHCEIKEIAFRVGKAVVDFFVYVICAIYGTLTWICEKIEMLICCTCCEDGEDLPPDPKPTLPVPYSSPSRASDIPAETPSVVSEDKSPRIIDIGDYALEDDLPPPIPRPHQDAGPADGGPTGFLDSILRSITTSSKYHSKPARGKSTSSRNRSHASDLRKSSEDVKAMLMVHQEYPRLLVDEKVKAEKSSIEHTRWAATSLGKAIIDVAKTLLSEEEIDDLEASMPNGCVFFALLMLRATVFQTKTLHFRSDTDNAIPDGDVFEVPNFFTFENWEDQKYNNITAAEIVKLREDFWALKDGDKRMILEHIDSEVSGIKESGKPTGRFELIPPDAKRPTTAKKEEITEAAKNVHKRLLNYANKVIQNDLFRFTLQKSIS